MAASRRAARAKIPWSKFRAETTIAERKKPGRTTTKVINFVAGREQSKKTQHARTTALPAGRRDSFDRPQSQPQSAQAKEDVCKESAELFRASWPRLLPAPHSNKMRSIYAGREFVLC